jgi:DNA-binding NarL/FixJ family response regulator
MPQPYDVIIAEDNPRDREFLASNLTDFSLILSIDSTHALELALKTPAPCIITDLQMPGMNGIELAKHIWKQSPLARIVFWSHYGDETYIRSLSKIIPTETVYGYILKDNPSDILNKACHAVFDEDQCWIDARLRQAQSRTHTSDSAINDMEYEVLIDIALGLTDNMIAQRRYLSRRGAQNRLKSLYNKLGVTHDQDDLSHGEALNLRTRAISVAMRRGLLNNFELEQEEGNLQRWLKKQK